MEFLKQTLYLYLVLIIVSSVNIYGKQISTVFVLEPVESSGLDAFTSASEPESGAGTSTAGAPREPKTRSLDPETPNTQIITDDRPFDPAVTERHQQHSPAAASNNTNHHTQTQNHHNVQHHSPHPPASHSNSHPVTHQASHPPNHHDSHTPVHHANHSTTHHESHPHHETHATSHHDTHAPVHHDSHSPSPVHSNGSHSQSHHNTSSHSNSNHNMNQTATHHNSSHQAGHPTNTHSAQNVDKSQTTSRKMEEEAHLIPHKVAHAATRSANHQTSSSHTNQTPKPRTTSTTTQSYDQETTPKTEERLLISITSNDDDEDYKRPLKQVGSSGSTDNYEQPQTANQQPHHNHRKPSITISIQDPSLKQNGGSGAVIVRPSENGQSIVISTVGGSPAIVTSGGGSNLNHDSNSGTHKPPHSTLNPSVTNNGDHNEPPYREPINIPIGSSHSVPTSTRRPPTLLVSEHNQNKPIVSTLIDQPHRPSSNQGLTDERPQRPTTSEDSSYDIQPTSRPVIVHPTLEPSSGYSENQQDPSSGSSNSRPQQQVESKYPLNEKNCGLVHETRIVGGDEANPDDFLWMAAIIKSRPKDGDAKPFCGGSLITRRHILTAAHCLENLAPRDVLVRLGSYDFDDTTASSLSADYAIDQFRVPAHYSKKSHVADIAIMRLKTPLALNENYKTVCMPQARRSYVGALGTVTGYGSQSQTFRRAAPKLRQVTVPIWENRKCAVVYKRNMTDSFLCAGYEEGGKDACQGDSGGPLMTQGPNESMMIVGVVSHGIGCGAPGYPGVYTRTSTYLDWIEKNTRE